MKTAGMPFQDIDQGFKRIAWACVLFYGALALVINLIQVPPSEHPDFTRLPPRITRLIIESAKPQPPPIPPTPREEKKEEPESVKSEEPAPASPETAKKQEPVPEESQRKKNMEIAMNSGLLKLLKQPETKTESSGAQDEKLKKALSEIKTLRQAPNRAADVTAQAPAAPTPGIDDIVAKLEKSIKASKPAAGSSPMAGSGGIGQGLEDLPADPGGTALKERKTSTVESPFRIKGLEDGTSSRSYESIAQVVDSYKGGISFIYNKALRENPTLRGTVTIEFIIAAAGEVIDCRVVSSSMNNPSFEEAVVKRVLQWKFSPVSGGKVTVTYPLVFSVSG